MENAGLGRGLANDHPGRPDRLAVLHHLGGVGRLIDEDVPLAEFARQPAQALHVVDELCLMALREIRVEGRHGLRAKNARHLDMGLLLELTQFSHQFLVEQQRIGPRRCRRSGIAALDQFLAHRRNARVAATGLHQFAIRYRLGGGTATLGAEFAQGLFHGRIGRVSRVERLEIIRRVGRPCQHPGCHVPGHRSGVDVMIGRQLAGVEQAA